MKEQLDKFYFTEDLNKSFKNFNDWVLGISFGIFSLIIFKLDLSININSINQKIYFCLIIFSMLILFYHGYIKYVIFQREMKLNFILGKLKKSRSLFWIKKEDKNEFKKILEDEWIPKSNNLKKINSLVYYSKYLIFFDILFLGLYILFNIIF